MEEIFDKIDFKTIEMFEKSIKKKLSIYLINSANEKGILDKKMTEHILHFI